MVCGGARAHGRSDLNQQQLESHRSPQLAEGMPECSASTMSELEAQLVDACTEAAGKEFKGFNYQCDMVTKTVALFTASPNPKPAGA